MGPPSKIMSEAEKVQTFKNTAMNATIEMQTRVFISTWPDTAKCRRRCRAYNYSRLLNYLRVAAL